MTLSGHLHQIGKGSTSYSFAVGSQFGPRSVRWIISIQGQEVYVSAENSKRSWHASLHESGQWHIKPHKHVPGTPKTIVKTHRDLVSDNHKVGLYIVIPDSCLRHAREPHRFEIPDLWIARPPYGGVVEVAIMTWDYVGDKHPHSGEEWPGQLSGTQLVAAYAFDNDARWRTLGVLTRFLGPDDELSKLTEASRPQAKAIVLDSPERRAQLITKTKHGSLCCVEYAID